MTEKVEESLAERPWWRDSWPYLLVVVFATGAFGLLGGLVISGIVWWLGRWRRVQIVAFLVLIPCLFVTWMVVQNQRRQHLHEVATAVASAVEEAPSHSGEATLLAVGSASIVYDALDPENPKNDGQVPPAPFEEHPRISAAGSAEWNTSVAIFMGRNPSIFNPNNNKLFDEKLAENASEMMTDEDRLRTAYFAAVADPRWEKHWDNKR